MKTRYIWLPIIFFQFMFLSNCGEGTVEIDQSTYEPKIVINGLIYPGKKIDQIKITRNFPLNTNINFNDIPLKDAFVTISNEENVFDTLFYNPDSGYFETQNQKINVEGGEQYRLFVSAEIDGSNLSATSTTFVPEVGFEINDELSCIGNIPYRRYYVDGLLRSPCITYTRSPGAEFYAISGNAIDASYTTFIVDNLFGVKEDILDENFDYFKYFEWWSAPDNRIEGTSTIEIPWWVIYFYGRYRVILYAGDLNFYHFFGTHRYVQDIDGNLREPLFYIEGDGIGVFGSAITDTVYFNITKN